MILVKEPNILSLAEHGCTMPQNNSVEVDNLGESMTGHTGTDNNGVKLVNFLDLVCRCLPYGISHTSASTRPHSTRLGTLDD